MTQTLGPAAELIQQLDEEELLAQFHEGARPASPEILELIAQYKEDSVLEKEIKARKDAAKALILEEMDRLDVNKFTKNGVVVVEDIHFIRTEWDHKALLREIPEAERFMVKKPSTRFDVKK